jgi:hypothetical protein
MSIIEIILSSNTAYVLLLYLISAKVQSRRFKETISHTLTKNVILVLHILVCTKWIVYLDLWMKHWISAKVTKGNARHIGTRTNWHQDISALMKTYQHQTLEKSALWKNVNVFSSLFYI